MNKFSTLVRSISPFVKKKDKRSGSFSSSKAESVEEAPASSTYTWDLTNIDVAVALKYFYKEHNPEKINTIEYILGQYVGEEVLMLQTLCERYNVDEEDMQYYLDKGKIKKKDRKKSVMETKSLREGSANEGNDKPNYNEFSWKLSHCDVGQSLKQLYKDHNPLKTPNIALLNEKTNEETINLLQQLCKRHSLTEADMQRYLDMFNKKKNRSSVAATPTTTSVAAPKTPAAAPERAPSSRVPFSSTAPPDENYTTLAESPLPGSRHTPTAAAAPSTPAPISMAPAPAAAQEGSETDSVPPPPPPALTPKMNSSKTLASPPPPPNTATAATAAPNTGPPPPPPPGGSPPPPAGGIARPPLPPGGASKSSAAALFSSANSNEDANSVKSGMSKVSMNHMRPVLAGGKRFSMGPVLRQINSRMNQDSTQDDAANTAGNVSTVSSNSAAGGVVALTKGAEAELEQMRAELELTRQQMLDVSKESQEVMRMLKDSAQTINTNLNSAAVTAITLAQQQQEQMEIEQRAKEQQKKEQIEAKRKAAAARAVEAAAEKERVSAYPAQIEELTKQNKGQGERIKMLEDMERQLRSRCDQLQMKHDEMKAKMEEALLDRQDAVEDKEDLLQLISVMHSSPIAVKNILESFLTKLGQSTGSMSVMLGVSKEGAQLSIAERISEALLIKRQQGRELNNVLSPKKAFQSASEDSLASIVAAGGVTNGGTSGTATGNNSVANSRSPTPVQHHHQSVTEGAKSTKVTEEEFKAYQRLNQQTSMMAASANGTTGNGANANSNRRGNESPSMRLLQRSASAGASGSPTSSPRNADQLMVEQYELAKRFFDNQQANNRIAHQMEESNLALQEMKTEQMISKTLESNKKISALGKTQLADDWIECYDPRTKKTYWHSPSLKKSTWHKPSANSALVAGAVDKSLHPTHLQMQQGGKAAPNGLQVLTGTSLLEGSDYGGSLPPSRYNSPSLARGMNNALQHQQQQQLGGGGFYNESFANNNNASFALGNLGSPGDDDQQMHATLNEIINRSKNTTQQQITQQQLYLLQQQQHMQQTQVPFQSYNNAPMSTDELRSHHSFDSLFEAENHQVMSNLPRPPSTAPSVTSELNSITVSNSSRPSSASRARPPPNNGGRNSRSASPALPTRGQMTSKQQQLNNMPWVMAVDPKSQRKYWYNRETKVSTWRMPVELMN